MKKRIYIIFTILLLVIIVISSILIIKNNNDKKFKVKYEKRYDEIREGVKKAVEWNIKASYPKCPITNNNKEPKGAGMYYNSSFLINNGYIKKEELKDEEYEKISNLNIKSVYVCSKTAVKYLKKTKGVILNTSSMVSIYGQPSGVMYPTSKFAVNGMTKSLARELAPLGIRVNAVAPGITNTDMVKNLPKEMIEPLIKTIPLGRIGEPEDIANAFLFLGSDMASYISGVILSVDGLARS